MNKKYGNSIGFAVVDLGNAGKIHMEAIEKAGGAFLAAVCDSNIGELAITGNLTVLLLKECF